MALPSDTLVVEPIPHSAAPPRTPAPLAALLPLLDVAAGRCAATHARSPHIVTGSFDDIRVVALLHPADLVEVRATVVHVGARSMLIRLRAHRLARSVLATRPRRLVAM